MQRYSAICRRWRLFLNSGWLWLALLLAGPGARGQEFLSLCTEEALRTAMQIGGSYRIECSSSAALNIPLSRPLIVERDLTLVSTQEVLLDGKSLTRVLIVKPGVRLTLDRIFVFSGRQTPTNANNGGIDDTAGAGLYNDGGIVTILNSRFVANSVVGVTGSPGTAGSGDDGEAGGDAAGAAIYNNGGQITISNTTFSANIVTPGVGGAGGSGSGSGGDGGRGGNGGSSGGAAIYSLGGSVIVLNSTFTNNAATGALGGAAGAGSGLLGFPGEPGEAGDGVGAAIAGAGADLAVSGSTFMTNKVTGANGQAGLAGPRNRDGARGLSGGEGAGGAIYSTGTLRMTNCTFFGNAATGGNGGAGGAGGASGFGGDGGDGGDGGAGSGAGVESTGPATLINCTFSDNVATGGTGGAGGVGAVLGENGRAGSTGAALGAGIHATGAQASIANTILASSGTTVSGSVTDLGGNLVTDLNPLIVSAQSLRLTNPFLTALAANGGPTLTLALQSNSPAINKGLQRYCPPTDQRGTNRYLCDIGAYEIFSLESVVLPPIPASVLTNSIVRTATNLVEIRWASGYTNLFLQFKTNLNLANWTTLTNVPGATNPGVSLVLAVNLTNTTRAEAFFRLIGITNLANTNLLFLTNPVTATNMAAPSAF